MSSTAFAGGPVFARLGAPTTAAEERVAPETWLHPGWASDGADQQAAIPDQFCSLDFTLPDDIAGSADQLSTQLYRNKQLQDSLLQKEEELARLQEENSHLRQFLNSALVKCLEEKTKTLLWPNGQRSQRGFRSGKRRLKVEDAVVVPEASHPQKARRNLFDAFSACEENTPNPTVDTWVLQTLGLKDLNTIDESSSANYSALASNVSPGPFLPDPIGPTDFADIGGQPAAYGCGALAPQDCTADRREEPLPYTPHPLSLCRCPSVAQNQAPLTPCALPCCSDDASPVKMDVAFKTSLSPHCNVKTHTFRQGQAFVRRDEDGGWKLTWVPKQPE